ncbi:MAG: hypothetical protein HKN29_01495 [Rhodothermales bacterium]|nr:hypothetical protein [Rhodothermales bacterium]
MSRSGATFFTAVLALLAHLTLGWVAVIPAAALGGFLVEKRGATIGLVGVLTAWGLLVAYSYAIAPGPTQEMTRVVGALAGGLPSVAIPVATLLVGGLLGATAGWAGSSLRNILR